MTGSENGGSNKQRTGSDIQKEAGIYEDEINFMDYFLVLWERKWFIFLASILPALLTGLIIFLLPRDYKIAYIYNMGLDEKAFKVLEYTFYSTENLHSLVEKLREGGFDKYAKKIAESNTIEDLKELISFEISPSYLEVMKPSGTKDLEELQKLQQLRGSFLIMYVVANSGGNIREIASVCRQNFEQIIPLYSEKEELNNKIITLKENMASIEEARYTLNLDLERKKSTLEKLKNSGPGSLDRLPSDIILQFNDVGNNSTYLPLPYQIQAAETQIINLEEQIRANKEKYNYYAGLLDMNEKLLSYVKKIISSYYTLEQFHSFLNDTLEVYKGRELLDYLNAYIKRTENKMASATPLVEKPKVYPIAKGTVRKGGLAFAIAFMLSIFTAFLLEGLKKSRARVS